MQRRWVPCLLSVMLGLLLLPAAALAQNRNSGWGGRRVTANNQSNNGNNRNGTWGNRNRTGGTRNPASVDRGRWGYRNSGYSGNPTYRNGGYAAYRDRDGDGDRDHWRHRHHRRHDDDNDDDRGWRNNGRWNGSTPPGWQHGNKTGWGNSGLPPGQAKKQGW